MTTNELVNKIESIPGMSCDVSPFGIGCIDVLDLSQGGDGDHIIARIVMNIKNQVDTSGWLPKVVPDEVMSIIVEYVMTPVSERGGYLMKTKEFVNKLETKGYKVLRLSQMDRGKLVLRNGESVAYIADEDFRVNIKVPIPQEDAELIICYAYKLLEAFG